jgi:hypothetical protein
MSSNGKRKSLGNPRKISGDAPTDAALRQLAEVLADIACNPEVPKLDELNEEPVGNQGRREEGEAPCAPTESHETVQEGG